MLGLKVLIVGLKRFNAPDRLCKTQRLVTTMFKKNEKI